MCAAKGQLCNEKNRVQLCNESSGELGQVHSTATAVGAHGYTAGGRRRQGRGLCTDRTV